MFNRNSSPIESPAVTVQDGVFAAAWGYSIDEWLQLTEAARRDCRNRIVYAPHFHTATA